MQKYVRFIISFVVGIAMLCIAMDAAIKAIQYNDPNPNGSRGRTILYMKELTPAIDDFHLANHRFPSNLAELGTVSNDTYGVDGYGNPFVYSVHNGSYTLMSLGDDGKPGGTGADADITMSNYRTLSDDMTFSQIIRNSMYRETISYTFLSGLISFVICYITLRKENWSRKRASSITYKLIFTLIVTYFVTGIITALHVPSGH